MTELEKQYEIYRQLLKALKEAEEIVSQIKKQIYRQKQKILEMIE